jgi:hypothetical protein
VKSVSLALALTLAASAGAQAQAQAPQAPQAAPAYDPAPWIEDLAQFRGLLSTQYANLEWALTDRELDPNVFVDAEARLRSAKSDAEARQLFDRFASGLGDGHVRFEWPAPAVPTGSAASAAPASPCASLGFRPRKDGSAIGPNLPGYKALEANGSAFPAGTVAVDGRTVGVIRIAAFMTQSYPQVCEAALADLKRDPTAPCDKDCLAALDKAASDRFTRDLAARLHALKAAGAQALVVDLAGNGGGTEWSEAAVRMVTGVRLRSPQVAFIRHPHWSGRFENDTRYFAEFAKTLKGRDRQLFTEISAAAGDAFTQAKTPCDPAALWKGAKPDCAFLARAKFYSSGWLDSADPATLKDKPWAGDIFTPARFPYEEGAWTGPLMLVVDSRTASAAEEFAAIIQDNKAGVIVGAPTLGAGCGYTDGGVKAVLKNSGAIAWLPDCARFRADGSNEVRGVDPDVYTGFRSNEGSKRRAERLMKALPAAVKAADALVKQ